MKKMLKAAVEIHRCFKCNGYNHSAKFCKNEFSCPRCGENHEVKDCQSRDLRCVNCFNHFNSGESNINFVHAAWDIQNCPSYSLTCNKLRSDILNLQ